MPLLSVPVPRTLLPSRKTTSSPSGGRPTIALTFAVKVTLCPDTEGLADELTTVVVLPLFTVWVRFAEVLVLKLASPL